MTDNNQQERRVRQDMQIKQIMTKLNEMHDDVKSTNGRVKSLENWRSFLTGGMIVLALFVLPVVKMVVSNWIRG